MSALDAETVKEVRIAYPCGDSQVFTVSLAAVPAELILAASALVPCPSCRDKNLAPVLVSAQWELIGQLVTHAADHSTGVTRA